LGKYTTQQTQGNFTRDLRQLVTDLLQRSYGETAVMDVDLKWTNKVDDDNS